MIPGVRRAAWPAASAAGESGAGLKPAPWTRGRMARRHRPRSHFRNVSLHSGLAGVKPATKKAASRGLSASQYAMYPASALALRRTVVEQGTDRWGVLAANESVQAILQSGLGSHATHVEGWDFVRIACIPEARLLRVEHIALPAIVEAGVPPVFWSRNTPTVGSTGLREFRHLSCR